MQYKRYKDAQVHIRKSKAFRRLSDFWGKRDLTEMKNDN